jgi:hypothetical protein
MKQKTLLAILALGFSATSAIGSLFPGAKFPVTDPVGEVAVGDFNGDGRQDLVTGGVSL